VLVKWYKMVSWIVDRVDHFPKHSFYRGRSATPQQTHGAGLLEGKILT